MTLPQWPWLIHVLISLIGSHTESVEVIDLDETAEWRDTSELKLLTNYLRGVEEFEKPWRGSRQQFLLTACHELIVSLNSSEIKFLWAGFSINQMLK